MRLFKSKVSFKDRTTILVQFPVKTCIRRPEQSSRAKVQNATDRMFKARSKRSGANRREKLLKVSLPSTNKVK